jgi:hypothetical protein
MMRALVTEPRGPLVLGRELLGVVAREGCGFTKGELVTATVRRPCGRCAPCDEGAPDSCLTAADPRSAVARPARCARRADVDLRAGASARTHKSEAVSRGGCSAHRQDWLSAVDALAAMDPELLRAFIGLRVPLEQFEHAFAYRGGKATLVLDP